MRRDAALRDLVGAIQSASRHCAPRQNFGAACSFDMPKSHNPLNAYMPDPVPEPGLANSPRSDSAGARRQALSFVERCHRPRAGRQSRSGDCALQPANREYRHSAHQSRRFFSRSQYGRGAGNSRRRRGRFRHGRSGRGSRRHHRRRGRRGRRRIRSCAVDSGRRHTFLRTIRLSI